MIVHLKIGQNTAKVIKKQYSKIDLLLVGYTGASDYPCSYDLELSEKERVAKLKKDKRLQMLLTISRFLILNIIYHLLEDMFGRKTHFFNET